MPTRLLDRRLIPTGVACALLVTPAIAELTHRYTFTTDATDSVGTAHGTLLGGAIISGDAVLLDGIAGTYVELPPGLIEGYASVTLETWAITDANANWNRLFDFGDFNANNQGRNYLFVSTHSGAADVRVVISDADPGFNHEEWAAIPGNLDNYGFVHVVAVVDPPNGWLALYIDGQLVASNPSLTIPLSAVATNYCWLGRSLYAADPYYLGGIDDFRIHDSALTSGEVAAAFQVGPDVTDYDPGTLTALSLTLPARLLVNGVATPTLSGNFSVVGQISLGLAEVELSSSNPDVVQVLPNGQLRGLASGPATITATVGAVSTTASITVQAVPAELKHRWSMNEPAGSATVTDSVGGQNGTLYPAADGPNVVTLGNGVASFPGGAGYVNGAYIDLPDYLLNTKTNVTLETWATWRGPATTVWSRIFDFGTSSKGDSPHADGGGTSSFWLSPNSGANVVRFDAWNGSAGPALAGSSPLPIGQESHIVCIYAPDSGVSQLWVNGAMVASANTPFALSSMLDVNNWLGVSQWNDSPLNGDINELRIYEGALGEFEIALSRQAGPDALPADPGLLQSVALNAPAALLNGNPQPDQALLLATYENMADVDVSTLSGAVFTSSNPDVFTVSVNGQLAPVSVGSAELTAEYGGLSETVEIQVLDPTALTLAIDSPQPAGGPFVNVVLTAEYDGAPSADVRTFAGATFTSDNPAAATITANGAVLPLRVGTTMLTGQFAGLTANTTVQVSLPDAYEPATLIHRYSFGESVGSTTVQDSVGTAHGELRNPGAGSDFNGTGRLLLGGGAWNAVPEPAYVNLPNGLVSSLPSVTLEAWVRWSGPANSSWQRIFDFGRNSATDGSGNFVEDMFANPGLSYMFLSPRSGANTIRFAIKEGNGPELPVLDVAPMPLDTDTHVAVVYDTAAGAARLYVNGQRVATGPITFPLSVVEDLNVYLGRAQWEDPNFAGEFDEFRVYQGTFLDDEVATAFAAGPDELPTAAPSLSIEVADGSLVLRWPASATGFSLESTPTLGSGSNWTAVANEPTVDRDMLKVVLPIAGAEGYYRLIQ